MEIKEEERSLWWKKQRTDYWERYKRLPSREELLEWRQT